MKLLFISQVLLDRKISVHLHRAPRRSEKKNGLKHWGLPYAGLSADQVQAVLSQPSKEYYGPKNPQMSNEDTRSHSSIPTRN